MHPLSALTRFYFRDALNANVTLLLNLYFVLKKEHKTDFYHVLICTTKSIILTVSNETFNKIKSRNKVIVKQLF